jgi:putative peptidoglycan lipid II flippase
VSSLLRSNLVVAAGTALSRVSGLLRVFVFVYVIGQEGLADAYKLANETPNIVYDLLIGGVLSATLVPLFTAFMGTERHDADDRATNVVITIATTLMIAITVIAVAAAPLIFRLYSLNLGDEVDADLFRDVGTTLTRIFLIQILFYGLAGIANAYLNSRRRFFAAAWSPILPNLIIVITLLTLPGAGDTMWSLDDVITSERVRWTLGLGATAGIAAMAAVVVPAMVAAGLHFRPVFDWKHPAVRKLLVLSGWTIGFVVANQVALIVVRNLALGEGEGIAAAYFDAFVWFVLPHGLLAVSIATTFQPEMARAVTDRDRTAFIHHNSLGTRLIALLTLPAAAGMFVLREPIIGLMQRGQFDAEDLHNTSRALAGLSIGLVGFSIYLFTLRGFYAHQDTRTPFVLNVGENLLNIVLAFVLVGRWGVLGLGLAYSLAYLASSVWALSTLSYKVRGLRLREVMGGMWKMLLAAVLMAEAMWFVTHGVDSNVGWHGFAQIVVGGVVGLLVYVAVLLALRADEMSWLQHRLRPMSHPSDDLEG